MKRIQLTWSRSKDDNTKSYRVFRGTKPNATRRDILIMEVEHNSIPNPRFIEGDLLTRKENGFYESRYKNIMTDEETYPVTIFLNGVEVSTLGLEYGVDHEGGIFIFDTEFNSGDELVASYSIDAIRAYDTDEIEQEAITYFGPPARDRTEAKVPENISLMPDDVNAKIDLSWAESSTAGQNYYYRVESIDELGNFSMLSHEESVFLQEGLDNKGYLIERSFDNANWHAVARQSASHYSEYGVDREPPDAPTNQAQVTFMNYNESTADVHLSWDAATKGAPSASPYYRIRTITALGTLSFPSEVIGPVYLTSDISRYVIRRKVYDGAFPTLKGNDGITIGQTGKDGLTFVDADVTDNTVYAYSIYAIDVAGNPSVAATVLADVGDATPPAALDALTVTVASHSYII